MSVTFYVCNQMQYNKYLPENTVLMCAALTYILLDLSYLITAGTSKCCAFGKAVYTVTDLCGCMTHRSKNSPPGVYPTLRSLVVAQKPVYA